MSTQQTTHRTTPETLPEDLSSPRAKLVYLYLDVAGTATLQDVQDHLDMRKLELLSVLGSLTKAEHVDADAGTYTLAN